jgi:MoaA/NifB/PqqE/SkfB family radical SAM enzyme
MLGYIDISFSRCLTSSNKLSGCSASPALQPRITRSTARRGVMADALAKVLGWLQSRSGVRPFDALQVEVSSRCNLKCVMCPGSVLAHGWPRHDMEWETFEALSTAFERATWVYLQGWGEPLLQPRIFDMVARAKGAGCNVGFTTNGTLLTKATSERLLEAGLDLLCVSIAGGTAATHESIRVGSDFAEIIENLHQFAHLRGAGKSAKVKLRVMLLMTRSNVAELPRVVEFAASAHADEVVATNLDLVVTPALDGMKAYAAGSLAEAAHKAMDDARATAARCGIAFRCYPLEPQELAVCELNPLKIVFISADGAVSPCVYTSLPGQTEIPRFVDGASVRAPVLHFGNVREMPLQEIWDRPDYSAFRRHFGTRLVQKAMAFGAPPEQSAAQGQAPAPEPCRNCPKLYGL